MICGKVSKRESFRSWAMQAGHTWNGNDEERSFACRCSLPYKRASSARYVVATMRDRGTERTCASISRSITVGTMVLSSFIADCCSWFAHLERQFARMESECGIQS